MDTIRAKKVIARLFAILRGRRGQRPTRRRVPRLALQLPTPVTETDADTQRPRAPATNQTASVRAINPELQPLRASDGSLSPEALRDVYWILQRWRGRSMVAMMALYRSHLLRKGWSELGAESRVAEIGLFVADALGVKARPDANSELRIDCMAPRHGVSTPRAEKGGKS